MLQISFKRSVHGSIEVHWFANMQTLRLIVIIRCHMLIMRGVGDPEIIIDSLRGQ